jgi:hypothetical protein
MILVPDVTSAMAPSREILLPGSTTTRMRCRASNATTLTQLTELESSGPARGTGCCKVPTLLWYKPPVPNNVDCEGDIHGK